MSSNGRGNSTMSRLMGYLRQMSSEKGDQRGNESRLRGLTASPGRGYARVPSRGTISASTTSTSLATDFGGSHTQLSLPRALFPSKDYSEEYLEEYLEEDEILGDEESQALTHTENDEDFEKIRRHFQQLRQVSLGHSNKYKMEMEIKGIKDENLRSAMPHLENLSGSQKLKEEYAVDMENSTYRPTTQKINIKNQILAAVAVSLGSLVVGYCTAYTSPALVTMVHENSTVTVSKHEGSWVGGLMPLAALVGGVLGGPLIESIGRRTTLIAISIPFIVSWLTIALATEVAIIYAGRAIGGLCVGIGSLCFPVYLGEVIQPEVRGQLGLLPTALGNIGILVCFIAGKYLDWSGLAYLGAALPVPFLILMLVIPETPRWLATHKGEEQANKSLQWLRGKDTDVNDELSDIMNTLADSANERSGIRDMFQRKYCSAVFIALGLMFFQQMSGINAVIFYTVSIFRDAGSTIDENLSTIIVGIVNFASTFVATGLIERLGRKVLLYISATTMIITLMTLGTFFYFKTHFSESVEAYGWVPLASFVLYVIGFSLGFGPIPWLMMGEILPGKIRGAAASLCTGFNWTCTFFVTKTFADIVENIGQYGTFWMFAVICMFGLAFTIVFVPETKGKSLEEIEKKLAGSSDSESESSDYDKKRPINC